MSSFQNLTLGESVVENSFSKFPFSLLLFHDYWINFYNSTLWRPNVKTANLLTLVYRQGELKNYEFWNFVAEMDPKRYFKTVSQKDLLTKNNNDWFFGSKTGQTKHKPFRVSDFSRLFARNCSLHLENILLE